MVLTRIIPIYNEDNETLSQLYELLSQPTAVETILVDASEESYRLDQRENIKSDDRRWWQIPGTRLLRSTAKGRARQMNQGALAASGDWLFFMHADSVPQLDIAQLPERMNNQANGWGRFEVQFNAAGLLYPIIAFLMNWRSRLTAICTGDQGLLIRRARFLRIGGFKHLALMEDIDISRRLKQTVGPLCFRPAMAISARRWQQEGVLGTILLMWRLRILYWLGVDTMVLKEKYRDARGDMS